MRQRVWYRIGIYWTPMNSVDEGAMNHEVSIRVDAAPTGRLMKMIGRTITALLRAKGWIQK